ncbi:hypothetical protein ACYULU_15785, partial [Breznakiellaceae bacterium SP9]
MKHTVLNRKLGSVCLTLIGMAAIIGITACSSSANVEATASLEVAVWQEQVEVQQGQAWDELDELLMEQEQAEQAAKQAEQEQEQQARMMAARPEAQKYLDLGIAAEQKGAVFEALSYYLQADSCNSDLAEVKTRLDNMTKNIFSVNTGAGAQNDIQWRDQWVARLKECEEYVVKTLTYNPPYYLYYSTDIKQGEIDYEKRSVSLSFDIGSAPVYSTFSTVNQVVDTVTRGLKATGRDSIWKLDKWPAVSVSSSAHFLKDDHILGYWVQVDILNDRGASIGNRTVWLPRGWVRSLYPIGLMFIHIFCDDPSFINMVKPHPTIAKCNNPGRTLTLIPLPAA